MEVPTFKSKDEHYKWLVENKKELISQKKAEKKIADAISVNMPTSKVKTKGVIKAENDDNITVRAIINTTGLLDSHDDVHIEGIWDDSFKSNRRKLHLQEHNMSFDHIISEEPDLKTYVKEYTWMDLGYDWEGSTQALVFDSPIDKNRNTFMYNQYKNGYVKNHSVGMFYVDLELAINDAQYEAEFDVWNKYIDRIANKEYAMDKGYFWAVTKADFFEGSAVPNGSNFATPTLETKNQEKEDIYKENDVVEDIDETQEGSEETEGDVDEGNTLDNGHSEEESKPDYSIEYERDLEDIETM